MLADLPRVADREELLGSTIRLSFLNQGLADKGDRAFRKRPAKGAEHWPILLRLGVRNRSVRVSHDGRGNDAALQHQVRLHPEKGWVPDTEIRQFSCLNGADIAGNSLSNSRIDGVFGDVAPRPEVVVLAFFLGQPAELLFHFVGRLPGA